MAEKVKKKRKENREKRKKIVKKHNIVFSWRVLSVISYKFYLKGQYTLNAQKIIFQELLSLIGFFV